VDDAAAGAAGAKLLPTNGAHVRFCGSDRQRAMNSLCRSRAIAEPPAAALAELPGWKLEAGMLQKTYKHDTFPEAIVFVNADAHLAELANHHPDVDIRHSNITLRLTTHDSGGITAKDVELAKEVEAVRKKMGVPT
jgi:4a-hydroxytetrahydrobiopterin dehydratase